MTDFGDNRNNFEYLMDLDLRLNSAGSFPQKTLILEAELVGKNLSPEETEAVEQRKLALWANANPVNLEDWVLSCLEDQVIQNSGASDLYATAVKKKNSARKILGLPEDNSEAEAIGADHLQELTIASPKDLWNDFNRYSRKKRKNSK